MSGVATKVRRAEGHVLMAVALGRYSEGFTLSPLMPEMWGLSREVA